MNYELDFIGVSEQTKDADAIGIHWIDNDVHTIGIYDGGFELHGEKLRSIIENYYFANDKKDVDFIICSHSDQDHVSGLKSIIETLEVKRIYMNRPWLYIEELYKKINDGQISEKSLESRLKETYKYLCEIEELATEKNIEICEIFEGTIINERLSVLHPTRDNFISLIAESAKTDYLDSYEQNSLATAIKHAFAKIRKWVEETWLSESLRENEHTSAENETSVIVLGDMVTEKFLLVGDAGIRGLTAANDYYNSIGGSIKEEVQVYQIPHHGGRHNISTSVLNEIVGDFVNEGEYINKTAFVCAGKDSDHPLKMVTNAFIRRGVKVHVASGNCITHHIGIPDRQGWTTAKKEEFSSVVEEWED